MRKIKRDFLKICWDLEGRRTNICSIRNIVGAKTTDRAVLVNVSVLVNVKTCGSGDEEQKRAKKQNALDHFFLIASQKKTNRLECRD